MGHPDIGPLVIARYTVPLERVMNYSVVRSFGCLRYAPVSLCQPKWTFFRRNTRCLWKPTRSSIIIAAMRAQQIPRPT